MYYDYILNEYYTKARTLITIYTVSILMTEKYGGHVLSEQSS